MLNSHDGLMSHFEGLVCDVAKLPLQVIIPLDSISNASMKWILNNLSLYTVSMINPPK